MIFAEPLPFAEALAFMQRKRVLPTTLGSAQLAELDAELKRRAIFSAKVAMADHLQLLGELTEKIAGGLTEEGHAAGSGLGSARDRMISIPEAKAQLLESLQAKGYLPNIDGPLTDLTSDARLQLQVETNVLDTLGYGRWQAGNDEVALDVNPAWELVRMIEAEVPRNWSERWDAARAASVSEGATDAGSGRMVALKNHPIWQALGDGAGDYQDTLGNPWPPFAFNSGMNVVDVPREDAIGLGLLGENTRVPAASLGLNDGLEVSAERWSEALQGALAADPQLSLLDGVLTTRRAA